MRSPRTPFVLALTFLLAGLAAACGASGGEAGDPTTTTTVDQKQKQKSTTTTEGEITTSSERTNTTEQRSTTTSGPTPTTVARSAEAQTYVDALAASYGEDGAEYFTKPQATCVAGAYLDAVGVDALRAAGFSAEDFADSNGDDFDGKIAVTEAMGNQIFDRFEPCGIDLGSLFRNISGPGPLTPEQEACFSSILTPENLRASFVADYTGNENAPDPLDELKTCTGGTVTGN